MSVSVTVPLGQAITRTTQITFGPFDLGKWFVLGFSAWLATLGEGGGGFNFSYQTGGQASNSATGDGTDSVQPVWQWITTHLPWVIILGVVIAIAMIAVGLLITWLRSRAMFIFLDNLAENQAAIVAPWKQFKPLGNSLFLFYLILGIIALACYAAMLGLILIVALPDIRAEHFGGGAIAAIVLGLLLLPLGLAFALIAWCTNNFVVPLMYLRCQKILPAWREFRTVLLPGNVGAFVLFLLLQFVLRIAIGIISVLLGCITCCIGFLPYLSTVLTLPLHVFDRGYSVYFLEQFGQEYRIFRAIADPTGPAPSGPAPLSE
jgi:hypothetical protein